MEVLEVLLLSAFLGREPYSNCVTFVRKIEIDVNKINEVPT